MGAPQEQTQHELRQAEPSAEILLRQGTANSTTHPDSPSGTAVTTYPTDSTTDTTDSTTETI